MLYVVVSRGAEGGAEDARTGQGERRRAGSLGQAFEQGPWHRTKIEY